MLHKTLYCTRLYTEQDKLGARGPAGWEMLHAVFERLRYVPETVRCVQAPVCWA